MRNRQNSITKEMLKDWDSIRIPIRDYLKRTGKTIPITQLKIQNEKRKEIKD